MNKPKKKYCNVCKGCTEQADKNFHTIDQSYETK